MSNIKPSTLAKLALASFVLCILVDIGLMGAFWYLCILAAAWASLREVLVADVLLALFVLNIHLLVLMAMLTARQHTSYRVHRRLAARKDPTTLFYDNQGIPSSIHFDAEAFLFTHLPWWGYFFDYHICHICGPRSHLKCCVGSYIYELCTYIEERDDGTIVVKTRYVIRPHRHKLPVQERIYEAHGPLMRGVAQYADTRFVKEALSTWIVDVGTASSTYRIARQHRRDKYWDPAYFAEQNWRRRN